MELRVLKYFLVVAREENITKAASLLHVTQPTLSRQLMQLEELSGEISIGAGESNSMTALSQTMTAFRREHSLVRFSIYSATADDIKDRLEKGLLDLGLLAEPVNINLILNTANMVRNHMGAALGFFIGNLADELRFVPWPPHWKPERSWWGRRIRHFPGRPRPF